MRLISVSKYFRVLKHVMANWTRREAVFPFYASFKITSRCHFGCPFCNMNKNKTEDLSTADIKKILDNLSRSSVLMVSFEGGEPLLRSDIGDLLRYARSKAFYLLFTTSARNILKYPIQEYARYIDFLHVSIDEGHNNLDMFALLPDLVTLPTRVSVQTVVTKDTVDSLEKKVEFCHKAGANIVIIPASPMNNAQHCFPDIMKLESTVMHLYQRYTNTIHTPQGYFKAYKKHHCSAASVIIAPDGYLYYPCHILESKGPDLRKTDLGRWLVSPEAIAARKQMKECTKNCGWYQYYSIDSYTNVFSAWQSLKPALFGKKRPPAQLQQYCV